MYFNKLIDNLLKEDNRELSRQERIDLLKNNERMLTAQPKTGEFQTRIKKMAGKDYYVFGMTPDGRTYAVIDVYEKYDDGDRWFEEINSYYWIEGDDRGQWISRDEARELKERALREHPELNDVGYP